jgi:hypothetical protein
VEAVAPVQVWPRIPLQDLVTEMTDLKQIRLIGSDDPNAGGPIANVTVRDDISVDFAFDLPAVDGVSSAAAPRAATRRRGPVARKRRPSRMTLPMSPHAARGGVLILVALPWRAGS